MTEEQRAIASMPQLWIFSVPVILGGVIALGGIVCQVLGILLGSRDAE